MRVGGGVKGWKRVVVLCFIGEGGEWSDTGANSIGRGDEKWQRVKARRTRELDNMRGWRCGARVKAAWCTSKGRKKGG